MVTKRLHHKSLVLQTYKPTKLELALESREDQLVVFLYLKTEFTNDFICCKAMMYFAKKATFY